MRILLAAMLLLLSAEACRAQTIVQKDKQFSQDSLTAAQGATVVFANDDDVTHNLSVRNPDGSRLLSATQHPGDRTPVTLAGPGDYRVECLIHPKMKMTVTVPSQ